MEWLFLREYSGVRSRIVDWVVEIEQWPNTPLPHPMRKKTHGDYPREEDDLLWCRRGWAGGWSSRMVWFRTMHFEGWFRTMHFGGV